MTISFAPGSDRPEADELEAEDWYDDFQPEVVVRRNPWLSGTITALALLVGAAYLVRALGDGGPLTWVVAVLLGAVALSQVVALVDARSPLLVADAHGVRLRLGREWRGLPWSEVRHIAVEPRTSVLHDGRLLVAPWDLEATVAGIGGGARRTLGLARLLYGDPLVVPLGITTRVSSPDLVQDLGDLADGRAHVVELAGVVHGHVLPDDHDEDRDDHDDHDDRDDEPPAPQADDAPSGSVEGSRHRATRAMRGMVRSVAHLVSGDSTAAPRPLVTDTVTDTVSDFEPDVVPLVGPRVQAAREAVGLSVEQVSDRTRIRAHVVEAIEAEDFGPCGGDFYARGHLRSLASVLGLDADELVDDFDAAYSTDPAGSAALLAVGERAGSVGARFVGALRDMLRGPRWAVLAAVALSLVMVWSLARLVVGDQPQAAAPPSMVEQAAQLANQSTKQAAKQTRIGLSVPATARGGAVTVVVRDATKDVVWRGTLAPRQTHRVAGVAPLTVTAGRPGVVRVDESGQARGTVGKAGLRVG